MKEDKKGNEGKQDSQWLAESRRRPNLGIGPCWLGLARRTTFRQAALRLRCPIEADNAGDDGDAKRREMRETRGKDRKLERKRSKS